MLKRIATLVLLSLLASTSYGADDVATELENNWHQWRGPHATGVAPRGNPPIRWDEQTNISWKVELPGRGSSTPIIWGDRLFVTTGVVTDRIDETLLAPKDQPKRLFGITYPNQFYRLDVICLDRHTGDVLWHKTAVEEVPPEGHHNDNNYASASPMTDGKHLYISFGSSGVYCFDLEGNRVWGRKLGEMKTRLSFGGGISPVVHGDSLVMNWDHDGDSSVFVLDATNGNTRWSAEREEVTSWATPLVLDQDGHTQVIVNASNSVRSYDLKSGKTLWQCSGQVGNVIPSPVANASHVFCLSGYRGSAAYAISRDSQGDVSETDKVVWQANRDTPYVASPLLYGDRLYFNKSLSGVLTCLDATNGKALIEARRMRGIQSVYASPVGAAGRVYFVSRDGNTLVMDNSGDSKVLSNNQLDDPIDASPAIVGDTIYLRGHKYLYSIAEPKRS